MIRGRSPGHDPGSLTCPIDPICFQKSVSTVAGLDHPMIDQSFKVV